MTAGVMTTGTTAPAKLQPIDVFSKRIYSKIDVKALVPERYRGRDEELVRTAAMYWEAHKGEGNGNLQACTGESLLRAFQTSFEAGLPLDGKLGSVVKYGREAVFIPGYLGLVGIALQEGLVTDIQAYLVHETDDFEVYNGEVRHRANPFAPDRGKWVGGYCRILYPNQAVSFPDVVPIATLEKIRERAPGSRKPGSAWNTHRDEMYRKTILKRALKQFAACSRLAAAVRDEDRTYQEHQESRVVELGDLPSTREGETTPGDTPDTPAAPESQQTPTKSSFTRDGSYTSPSRPTHSDPVSADDFFQRQREEVERVSKSQPKPSKRDQLKAHSEVLLGRLRDLGWSDERIKLHVAPIPEKSWETESIENLEAYNQSLMGHKDEAEREHQEQNPNPSTPF